MKDTPLRKALAAALTVALIGSPLSAQYDATVPDPLPPLRGTVFVGGGGTLPDEVFQRFVESAGGATAKLIVLVNSQTATTPPLLAEARLVRVPPNDETAAALEALGDATGVWITGDSGAQLAATFRETPVEQALREVIGRAGVVGCNGEVATGLTATMITGGAFHATIDRGLDLIGGAVVDVGFSEQQRRNRLLGVLGSHPHLVGLGIDEGTAMVLHRRFVDVLGTGSVYACLAGNEDRPVRIERVDRRVSPRTQRRTPQPGDMNSGTRGERERGDNAAGGGRLRRLEDLVALSRAALARTLPKFPADVPPVPRVPKGSLIIIGGGGSPPGFMDRFMELAGGKDALLLYVPCTESEVANVEGTLAGWRRAGASNVDFIHTKDRHEADTSEVIHDKLRRAGGIFFGGGRQWNLVDSWQHTEAHRLMHAVLERGGVIAGSSAGASIQGSYMSRGNSLGNLDPMAEGYETGLGFLTGVAIDQHFTQRSRHGDMTQLVNHYPQLLGIGLDEAASIIVQGSIATCVCREGRKVHFYDRNLPVVPGAPDHLQLTSGQKYDLAARKIIE